MSDIIRITLRRAIALENPRWTLEQIGEAMREASAGLGPYAILLADLQAACEL